MKCLLHMKSSTEAWMIPSHIINLERRAMTVYLLVEGQVLSSVQNGTGGLQYIKPGKDKKKAFIIIIPMGFKASSTI